MSAVQAFSALTPAPISHVIRSGCHGNRRGSPYSPAGQVRVWLAGDPAGYRQPCMCRVGGVRPARPPPRAFRKLKDAGGGFLMAELLGKGVLCPLECQADGTVPGTFSRSAKSSVPLACIISRFMKVWYFVNMLLIYTSWHESFFRVFLFFFLGFFFFLLPPSVWFNCLLTVAVFVNDSHSSILIIGHRLVILLSCTVFYTLWPVRWKLVILDVSIVTLVLLSLLVVLREV